MDHAQLRSLYLAKNDYKKTLDHFSNRKNNSRETTVESLKTALYNDQHFLDETTIRDLFRGLEAANCGS